MTWRTVVAELVAVRVDVEEVVVLADGLELVERVAERPVVPQAGVQERVLVLLDRGLGQRRLAAVVADVPAVEVEREPGHRDVVAMYGGSWALLVRLDRDDLDDLRVDPADADRGDRTRPRSSAPAATCTRVNAPPTRNAAAIADRPVRTSKARNWA